jgi:pterin-4a-carbinolamine dehydratase
MNNGKWTKGVDGYSKDFLFDGFPSAMAFVSAIAQLAIHENHHPLILIDYNTVKLTYITGDTKPPSITEKDEVGIVSADATYRRLFR